MYTGLGTLVQTSIQYLPTAKIDNWWMTDDTNIFVGIGGEASKVMDKIWSIEEWLKTYAV